MSLTIHNYSCVSSDDEVDVPALLSLLGSAVDTLVLRALAEAGLHGLRLGHGYVVQRLLTGPATATEIAAALGISQQAVSKAAGEMVRLGYARVRPDSADRRRRALELTDRGREAVEVSRRARRRFEAELTASVGAGDVEVTTRVLAAALELAGRADAVRRRAVPPPPDLS
jgi:DNA-binding MarR family transcriptional regulator